jgi:tripartite-type tricarboxylate transporter receptor subunit TctC
MGEGHQGGKDHDGAITRQPDQSAGPAGVDLRLISRDLSPITGETKSMSKLRMAFVAALTATAVSPVIAQNYPARPVRVIVPYAAGGAVDSVARIVGQKLGDALGGTVIVDNRAGGATNIGSELVAKAAPDGYTLLAASASQAVNVTLYAKMPYDLRTELTGVAMIGISPQLLVVHPSLPVKSVKDLIALARAKPGGLTYASAGIASANHISGELFKSMAKVDIVHVPYKGGSQAITELIGGQVTMYFSSLPTAIPHVKSGRLRALGVTSAKRFGAVSEFPTIAEAGVPGYELVNWYAFLAPSATPRDIIARLNAAAAKVLAMVDVRERLTVEGVEVTAGTPQELNAFIVREIDKNANLIRSARIRPD